MIKLYVNGEWYATFENQVQFDKWYQAQDVEYLIENTFIIEYVEDKQQ